MKNKVAIFGGGTVNPIANHLSICSFAKGTTAKHLYNLFKDTKLEPQLYLSKMASEGKGDFHTNKDLEVLINAVKENQETKVIILTSAVCDFYYSNGSGNNKRPDSSMNFIPVLSPSPKIVSTIRDKDHKHIFLVAFKNTVGLTKQEMYLAGLSLCKKASANLVFVNDTLNGQNMIVTPEEASYADNIVRTKALQELVDITVMRSHLSFTRSTVVAGEAIKWDSDLIPSTLREVVEHCIRNKAYKEFNGATVGHFAYKVNDTTFLTSIRRSNFNDLHKIGLVKVVTDGPDEVTAYGFKPSVGGQSQRTVFSDHEQMDCIVHFHCPMKLDSRDNIPTRLQRDIECGSHECGKNTSSGLEEFGNLKAVYLDKHGPNIVFNSKIDHNEVIDFINANFNLNQKTGGYNLEQK